MSGVMTMLTGRFARETLRCAVRGEMPLEQAIGQALAHCPELWDRALDVLREAQEVAWTPSGIDVALAAHLIDPLVDAAMAAADQQRSRQSAGDHGEDGAA